MREIAINSLDRKRRLSDTFRMELVTTIEAGERLGISRRQAQRLVRDGVLHRVGIDRIDYGSVLALMAQRRDDHHRAWSEETAWAAIAMLSERNADWIGQAQRSRLKASLRTMDAEALVARTRNRARIHRLRGHSAAARRIMTEVVLTGSSAAIGDLVVDQDRLDGYIRADDYAGLTTRFRLERDWEGAITLRSTSFDIDEIGQIATSADALAGLDLAGSMDTRERLTGVTILNDALGHLHG
jgi:hypothetical protein